MKPKTELFLYTLLWGVNIVARPTFHSMNESFEGWSWRNGLLRRVQRLEQEGLVSVDERLGEKIITLTQKGRLLALGGFDPVVFWNSEWDGKWRIISFDLPESKRKLRHALRLTLRNQNFGCLQRSIWITPHHLENKLREKGIELKNHKGFAIMEGIFLGGADNKSIVESAWNFDHINNLYSRHRAILQESRSSECKEEIFNEWAKRELNLWREVIHMDPFLPRQLLPRGYQGIKGWELRMKVLGNLKKVF